MPDYPATHDIQPGQRVPVNSGVVALWIMMLVVLLLFIPYAVEDIIGILHDVAMSPG